jgi:hypothetical protein
MSGSVHQLDSFTPPGDATLDTAKAAGVECWPGYIGGPEAAIVWPPDAFGRIRAKGLRAAGIYVGLGSGADAVACAQARGIPAGEVIWHDVETQWSMSHENAGEVASWVSAVRGAGYLAGLYGTAAFVNQWGAGYDCVWAAGGAYYRTGPGVDPWPATTLNVPNCVPNRRPCGVQWWATHDEFGIGVDRSIMDPEFAASALPGGETDMTPEQLFNLKRMAVWMERLHHEVWPSDPNAQENDIDVFARQIGDNLDFEPVLTALHATFEGNHQLSSQERIAAIEARIAPA